ncbi:hypothetical protein EYF80_009307 [Liparis tanakae]|uniref:Uncharacterized protein n=1 Tax=Liparis tanakae TaxID=230148 RepID=A0A4Z2ISX6_9TELE|nr:hypothetical protein EYF80_009307 [Liparis tanakae]
MGPDSACQHRNDIIIFFPPQGSAQLHITTGMDSQRKKEKKENAVTENQAAPSRPLDKATANHLADWLRVAVTDGDVASRGKG